MNTKILLLLLVVVLIYLTWLVLHLAVFHRSFAARPIALPSIFIIGYRGFYF